MSAHTPGPWIAEVEDGDVEIVSGGVVIASIDSGEAEYIVNARLIAEAPELLRALRFATEALNAFCTEPMGVIAFGADHMAVWQIIGQAKSVMAKATMGKP